MAPHTLPTKKVTKVKKELKNNDIIEFQVGVDTLGFPIYQRHEVFNIKSDPNSKYHKGIRIPLDTIVIEKTVKQY